MKIERFNNTYTSATTFRSSLRTYQNPIFNSLTGAKIANTTALARDDFPISRLIDFLVEHFKNKSKVNINCFAGSDGSEAYTMAIGFLEKLTPKEQQKFFPIISSDNDSVIIESARNGKINLSQMDFNNLNKELKPKRQYFIPNGDMQKLEGELADPTLYKNYLVHSDLRNCVQFKQENLKDKLKELEDDGNSIILCRNVIPYLDPIYSCRIPYYAYKNLKSGSLFVIGNFDRFNTETADYLYWYGFSEVMRNVFMHP